MIAVPAAFTVPTGQAHWEVLLRARAIEAGRSSSLRRSRAVTRTAATPTAIRWSSTRGARCCSTWARARVCGLGRNRAAAVAEVRQRIPALSHRRPIAEASCDDRVRPQLPRRRRPVRGVVQLRMPTSTSRSARGLVQCPVLRVERRWRRRRWRRRSARRPRPTADVRNMLAELAALQAEDARAIRAGSAIDFADTARAMHLGEIEPRAGPRQGDRRREHGR